MTLDMISKTNQLCLHIISNGRVNTNLGLQQNEPAFVTGKSIVSRIAG